MIFNFSLLILSVIVAASSAVPDDEEWNNFKEEYKKNYANSTEEDERKEAYFVNKRYIEEHNKKYEAGESTYKLKINHFGDMSYEEYYNLMHPPAKNRTLLSLRFTYENFTKPIDIEVQDCLNWKDKGAVTPVRDQKLEKCGSCWAHAATGALEGQYFLKGGMLKPLSVQSLVDCTFDYGNYGCGGGGAHLSYQHVVDQGNIPTEAEYPYKAKTGECLYKIKDQEKIVNKSFGIIESNDEEAIKIALNIIGPLAAAVDGSNKDFRFYSEGIYNPSDCKEDPESLDHEVLIIGYCQDSENRDYWLIKNSFGADWGENGYFRVQRNKGKSCGVTSDVNYPII